MAIVNNSSKKSSNNSSKKSSENSQTRLYTCEEIIDSPNTYYDGCLNRLNLPIRGANRKPEEYIMER